MSSSNGTQGLTIPIATSGTRTATATATPPTTAWSRFSVSSVFTMKPRKCGSCG